MKITLSALCLVASLGICSTASAIDLLPRKVPRPKPAEGDHNSKAQAPNTLSALEKKEGFVLLFDGKTSKGFRGVYKTAFPEKGWEVKDGEITHLKAAGGESVSGGDIVTEKEYSSFELRLEFKLTEGANSGIKYFVVENDPTHKGSAIGCEFQLLDDEKHPDAKNGKDGNRTIGSLYGSDNGCQR